MNKKAKIISIICLVFVGISLLSLTAFGLYRSGALFAIGSLFAKSNNVEQPFSSDGVFVYENDNDDIDIQKINFSIKTYHSGDVYDASFKDSKKNKYGINIIDLIIENQMEVDYSLTFVKKEKKIRPQQCHSYTYLFEIQSSYKKYKFNLESYGEMSVLFSFIEPVYTEPVYLSNLNT